MAGLQEDRHGGLSSDSGYRILFEASPLPAWVYDAETLEFLAVNDAAVRHYGWSREEFLTMRITEIRPASEVEALLQGIRGGAVGSHVPETWRHRRRDGSLIDVEISAGQDRLRGPRRGARRLARRHRAAPDAGAARRGREDGGGRAPGGRRRARLQQPADRDLRLRGDPARGSRRRAAARRDRARRRAGGRADAPAAGVLAPPGAAPAGGRRQRDRGRDGPDARADHRRRRAGRDRARRQRLGGRGRPRPDRAGGAQPRRQRARRDARRRPADDRDRRRRCSRTPTSPRTARSRRGRTCCWRSATPASA